MTPVREAFVLPALFLTVALLGGLRIAEHVRLVPPPLVSLVLAMLLVGALVRSGALAPERLMNAQRAPARERLRRPRPPRALRRLGADLQPADAGDRAAARGLQRLLLRPARDDARGRERPANLLRSLAVLLGSAFVLRFIVLENLYAPDSGTLKRLLTTLIEGASLGTIDYQPHAAATGYLAFLTVVLYLIGLALLPAGGEHA